MIGVGHFQSCGDQSRACVRGIPHTESAGQYWNRRLLLLIRACSHLGPMHLHQIEETLEQNGRSSIGVKLADERSEDVAIDPAQIAPTVGCDVGGFQPQATSETAHGGLPWQLARVTEN